MGHLPGRPQRLALALFAVCATSVGAIAPVVALQAGPRSPALCTNQFFSGSTASWTQVNNAISSNDQYASAAFASSADGAYTSWLFCYQFGFTLPANASVEGIRVEVERRQNASGAAAVDKSVKIGLGGAQSADRASTDLWPATDTVKTYGGTNDLWGLAWSPSDINGNSFGVALSGAQSGVIPPNLQVDAIQVTVFYSTPSPTPTPTGTATATATNTLSPTKTATPTPTGTSTASPTATATATDTLSPAPTLSPTPTPTSTASPTATDTLPPTETSTPAPTATASAVDTSSPTVTNTPTASETPTATESPTSSVTPSPTVSRTPTRTPTASMTGTPTATPTVTHTATWTMIVTVTFPATRTPTRTPTPTPLGSDTCCQFTSVAACGQASGGACPSGSTDVRFAVCLGGQCATFTPKTGTPTPTPTVLCGNGILEPGEQCEPVATPNATPNPCCVNCQYRPAGSVCDRDGDPCTLDWCNLDGQCFKAANLPSGWSCDRDSNLCTADACDGAGSCVFMSNLPEGSPCDDSLFCNGVDLCDAAGVCTHSGDPCPGTECNQCNEVADNCFNPLGTPCTADNLVCTSDHCDGAGSCVHPLLPELQCAHGYTVLGDSSVRARLSFGAFSDAHVCSSETVLGSNTFVDGNAVGIDELRLARSAEVHGKCVTDRPFVFGPGSISALCTAGRVVHPNPTPPRPVEVENCETAWTLIHSRKAVLLQPTPGIPGPVIVTAGQSSTVDVQGKGAVVVVDSGILTLQRNATLVIKGDAATQAVILRVASDLALRANARILTFGIPDGPHGSPAERILLLVGGKVRLGRNAKVTGTIVASGDLTVGSFARVEGAVFAENRALRVQRGATIQHAPWVLW